MPARFRGDFEKLADRSDPWVSASGPTAAHFGWFEAFYGPKPFGDGYASWRDYAFNASPYGQKVVGGIQMIICSSPSRNGTPAGQTHCFRIGPRTRMRHLIWLASVTTGHWEWMTTKTRRRVLREEWLRWAVSNPYTGP